MIVSLIVIIALVALTFFGTQINDILSIIADTIDGRLDESFLSHFCPPALHAWFVNLSSMLGPCKRRMRSARPMGGKATPRAKGNT